MQREIQKLAVLAEQVGSYESSFRFPAGLIVEIASPEEAQNPAGKVLRLIQDPRATPSLAKIPPADQAESPESANRWLQFHKSSRFS